MCEADRSQTGSALRLTQTVLMEGSAISSFDILAAKLWVSARSPSANKPLTAQPWSIGLGFFSLGPRWTRATNRR